MIRVQGDRQAVPIALTDSGEKTVASPAVILGQSVSQWFHAARVREQRPNVSVVMTGIGDRYVRTVATQPGVNALEL